MFTATFIMFTAEYFKPTATYIMLTATYNMLTAKPYKPTTTIETTRHKYKQPTASC